MQEMIDKFSGWRRGFEKTARSKLSYVLAWPLNDDNTASTSQHEILHILPFDTPTIPY